MAKLYYRGMAEQNGKPRIGRSARLLGIRPNVDIDIEQVPSGWINEARLFETSSRAQDRREPCSSSHKKYERHVGFSFR